MILEKHHLDQLPTRARNRLLAYFSEQFERGTIPTAELVSEARMDSLAMIAGIGPGIIKDIFDWLNEIGFEKKPEKKPDKWHIIDTAPRDGVRRLLYLNYQGREPVCGYWVWWRDMTGGYWWHDKLSTAKYKFKVGPHQLPQPSHWMPFLEPPK